MAEKVRTSVDREGHVYSSDESADKISAKFLKS